jgi:hypothetical protein
MKKQTLEERLKNYNQTPKPEISVANTLLFAASAVAGVGGMLIPPPAEAAIQYSGEKNWQVTKDDTSKKVDFDGAGGVFTFKMTFAGTSYTQQLAVTGVEGKVINDTANGNPANLNVNYSISSNKSFAAFNTANLATNASSASNPGNFLGKQGYLGVTFESNGSTYYGWIQYKASSDATIGTIIDWAYEDEAGKAIKTAETKSESFNWNLFLPAILAGRETQ